MFALHDSPPCHIFEISDDSRMRITTKTVHDRNDDFALHYVRIYPGVNSRAELVTLAPGKALRAVGSGIKSRRSRIQPVHC